MFRQKRERIHTSKNQSEKIYIRKQSHIVCRKSVHKRKGDYQLVRLQEKSLSARHATTERKRASRNTKLPELLQPAYTKAAILCTPVERTPQDTPSTDEDKLEGVPEDRAMLQRPSGSQQAILRNRSDAK